MVHPAQAGGAGRRGTGYGLQRIEEVKLIKERGSLFRVNGIPAASLPEKVNEMSKFATSILVLLLLPALCTAQYRPPGVRGSLDVTGRSVSLDTSGFRFTNEVVSLNTQSVIRLLTTFKGGSVRRQTPLASRSTATT